MTYHSHGSRILPYVKTAWEVLTGLILPASFVVVAAGEKCNSGFSYRRVRCISRTVKMAGYEKRVRARSGPRARSERPYSLNNSP